MKEHQCTWGNNWVLLFAWRLLRSRSVEREMVQEVIPSLSLGRESDNGGAKKASDNSSGSGESDKMAAEEGEQWQRMLRLLYGLGGTDQGWGQVWGHGQGEGQHGQGQGPFGQQGQDQEGFGQQGQGQLGQDPEGGHNWLLQHMEERRRGRGRAHNVTVAGDPVYGRSCSNTSLCSSACFVGPPRPVDALVHALLIRKVLRQHGATLRHVAVETEVSVLLGPMQEPLLVSHWHSVCTAEHKLFEYRMLTY